MARFCRACLPCSRRFRRRLEPSTASDSPQDTPRKGTELVRQGESQMPGVCRALTLQCDRCRRGRKDVGVPVVTSERTNSATGTKVAFTIKAQLSSPSGRVPSVPTNPKKLRHTRECRQNARLGGRCAVEKGLCWSVRLSLSSHTNTRRDLLSLAEMVSIVLWLAVRATWCAPTITVRCCAHSTHSKANVTLPRHATPNSGTCVRMGDVGRRSGLSASRPTKLATKAEATHDSGALFASLPASLSRASSPLTNPLSEQSTRARSL